MTQEQELARIGQAIERYQGYGPTLEAAIGAYFLGKKLGWRVLYLMHDRRTVEFYGRLLGIDFHHALPEVGDWAHKSLAWRETGQPASLWRSLIQGGSIRDRQMLDN